MIQIPCTCGHVLNSEELNKMNPEELANILAERPIEIICINCGYVFEVRNKTRAIIMDGEETWKSYS
jgi:redox-regulated HSP33 family molecular chaperone